MKIIDKKLIGIEEKDISSQGEVIIPNGVEEIDSNVFKKFDNIVSVILPNSIYKLTPETFKDCLNLEYVKMPERLELIPKSLFQNCKSLKEVKMPLLYRAIEESAFEGCSSLADFDFPVTLRVIKEKAFAKCDNFKNVIIPGSVTYSEPSIFEDCTGLETVTIYNKDLSPASFKNCKSLKSVVFYQRLYNLPESFFEGCTSLTDVVFNKICDVFSENSFSNCSSLENMEIPEGTKTIKSNAFLDCENLKTVTMPRSMEVIYGDAFSGCNSLENFTVPATVKKFFPSKSDSMLFFNKTDDWFYLSRKQESESIPVKYLNIDYIFLTKYWDYKDTILREQKNPINASFYSNFVSKLPREEAIDIIQNHNFTFINQLNLGGPSIDNEKTFKLLYNLGAVSKPVEINGKTIDYAQKVVNFFIEKTNNNLFYFSNLIDYNLGGLNSLKSEGLKPEFTDFFMKNFDAILEECKKDSSFFVKSYNNFYAIQKTNTSNRGEQRQLKPTIEKFKTYFLDNKYKGITDENKPIARKLTPYFDSQTTFNRAVEIDTQRKSQNVRDNILHRSLKESDVFASIDDYSRKISTTQAVILGNIGNIADNEFTFEWLAKNDPDNFILGKYCSCCSHLEGMGYGIMHASIIHPYVQNLVIKNGAGEIIAKSTLYINKNQRYGVCNNVEISNIVKKEDYEQIYQKYILGIQEFARAYNKEHPFLPLKQINVGMGRNDLEKYIREHRSESLFSLRALDYGKYGIDSNHYHGDSYRYQYIIWSAKEDSKILKSLKKELKNKESNPTLDI